MKNQAIEWTGQLFYDNRVRDNINQKVKLHTEVEHPRSSAASCLNVLGTLGLPGYSDDLKDFLNYFGLGIEEIIPFPAGADVKGEIYGDKGNVVFEWIGPKRSPINEVGGKRGQRRTSVDAYVLAKIQGKITQLMIEWKFTETYHGQSYAHKFGGRKGIERMRRYANVLTSLRKNNDFPFDMEEEGTFGLADLGYEPFYQLLRITLLAKTTTPLEIAPGLTVEDYRVIHLSHSENVEMNLLTATHLSFSPGLKENKDRSLHEVWRETVLAENERGKFFGGYWDEAIKMVSNSGLRNYLEARFC